MKNAFVFGFLIGYTLTLYRILRRSTTPMLSPAPLPGYPVVTDTDYRPGDAWPAGVTYSWLPPNPGEWSAN